MSSEKNYVDVLKILDEFRRRIEKKISKTSEEGATSLWEVAKETACVGTWSSSSYLVVSLLVLYLVSSLVWKGLSP